MVGLIERLRHECSVSPRQGQCGCRCSESYDHGSVSYIDRSKKELVKEVNWLTHLGVILEYSPNGCFMVYHNSESSFVVEVKFKEHLDQLLMEFKELVLSKLNESFPIGERFFEVSRKIMCVQC